MNLYISVSSPHESGQLARPHLIGPDYGRGSAEQASQATMFNPDLMNRENNSFLVLHGGLPNAGRQGQHSQQSIREELPVCAGAAGLLAVRYILLA
ncbi:MAG: hypothetical protein R3F46_05095 [bacterium]